MDHIIKNRWLQPNGRPYLKAEILNHTTHPEGLDVDRVRFVKAGNIKPAPSVGHIVSVLNGRGEVIAPGDQNRVLNIQSGVHLYLPPGQVHILNLEDGSELIKVSGASAEQASGDKLLLRDEEFIYAAATGSQSFRWILTPQYLSRRIFLHNDRILLSKSGNPVSWFRTTMFDVAGLPTNEDGDSVFKMSYNSRTEFNVCYDVQGKANVRFAHHPYQSKQQAWDPWQPIDSNSTYHLFESEDGPLAEWIADDNGKKQCFRNKHEVSIVDGHVTLFCLFDPAPTGVERHRPGEYSDYEPLANLLGTKLFEEHQKQIAKYDQMIDQLSLAKAENQLDQHKTGYLWEIYQQGLKAQHELESKLIDTLVNEGGGRQQVVAPWTQHPELGAIHAPQAAAVI